MSRRRRGVLTVRDVKHSIDGSCPKCANEYSEQNCIDWSDPEGDGWGGSFWKEVHKCPKCGTVFELANCT